MKMARNYQLDKDAEKETIRYAIMLPLIMHNERLISCPKVAISTYFSALCKQMFI